MLNCVYRLEEPRTIVPTFIEIEAEGKVIVRPTFLSICNADQRYYQGTRGKEAMEKKLPMALIHEGIGVVVSDRSGLFEKGQRVVMLPNNPVEDDDFIAENYLTSSQFCGSGYDGFMQEIVALPSSRVLPIPEGIIDEVAAFTELVSVAVHAITRFENISHPRRDRIGVWGDGNLGYIIALLLTRLYPESEIIIFGRNDYKMADFTFCSEQNNVNDLTGVCPIDHAFECCGGEGSIAAIRQIIDVIKPEGTLSILGVTENEAPINTRMVLEKGLRIFGSSRSGLADFQRTIELFSKYPEISGYLESLVGRVVPVKTIADIAKAFEFDMEKSSGKTIMQWRM